MSKGQGTKKIQWVNTVITSLTPSHTKYRSTFSHRPLQYRLLSPISKYWGTCFMVVVPGISTQISTVHHSSLDHIMQSLNHDILSSLQIVSFNHLLTSSTISDAIIYHSTLQSFDRAVCCPLYHFIVHCFGFLPAQTGRLGAKFKKSQFAHARGAGKTEPPVDSKNLVSLCTPTFMKHPNFLCFLLGRSIGSSSFFICHMSM